MAQGGTRQPSNPAPVGLPGALSQRTDGGPADKQPIRYISGLPYGEGQVMTNLQSTAPMEAASPTPTVSPSQISDATNPQAQGAAPIDITPLHTPTVMPDQPVTHGADAGPGPGLASLNLQSEDMANYQNASAMLSALAANANASPALKYLAQKINGVY